MWDVHVLNSGGNLHRKTTFQTWQAKKKHNKQTNKIENKLKNKNMGKKGAWNWIFFAKKYAPLILGNFFIPL